VLPLATPLLRLGYAKGNTHGVSEKAKLFQASTMSGLDVLPESLWLSLRPVAVSPRRSVAYGNTSLEAEGFWV